MINNVVLVGRITKDPELKRTQSGTSVCSFTLAVNRKVQAQGQPDTDFINCVAWNKTAELMVDYLHKGSLIGTEGRIQTRNYDNQQGQRVYVTEVVVNSVQFLEPKGSATGQYQSKTYRNPQPATAAWQSSNTGGYQPNMNFQNGNMDNGFSSAFDANDTLDIASDDLPF